MANRKAFRRAIENILGEHSASALFKRLMDAGIPAAVVRTVPEALNDPHAAHRGMIISRGEYRGVNSAQTLSRTPATLRDIPPTFARDTREVLAGAGYSAEEIETLVANGVAPLKRRVN
jgi:crotonobetainyl-CoA:carnitine CoA-transferase CaiB-like acyl-CoA transferase